MRRRKSLLCLLLSVLLVCSWLPYTALAAVLGDTDGADGVTAADARIILRAAVGLDTLSGEALSAADVNTDGNITAEDARLALRAAVGLELPANEVYANQYDILRSGEYYVELGESGVEDISMAIAVHGDRRWISATMEGMEISFLSAGNDMYMLDAKHRLYAAFDEDAMAFMGGDDGGMDALLDAMDGMVDFSGMPPLEEADFNREETLDGAVCTAYLFQENDGFIKVCMDGARILAFVRIDSRGRTTEVLRFAAVRAVLPAEPFSAPETYREIPDLMTFMLIAFSGSLGLDTLTDEDIQALIEEAVAGA